MPLLPPYGYSELLFQHPTASPASAFGDRRQVTSYKVFPHLAVCRSSYEATARNSLLATVSLGLLTPNGKVCGTGNKLDPAELLKHRHSCSVKFTESLRDLYVLSPERWWLLSVRLIHSWQ